MSAPSLARRRSRNSWLLTILMAVICLAFLAPILIVLMNSFKGKLFISTARSTFPAARRARSWALRTTPRASA